MIPRVLVGVDAVEPDRIRDRLLRTTALRDELFTASEQEYCEAQAHPYLHYAGRWSAKEAVIKCLAIDGFDPLEVEVLAGDPAPMLVLHGDVLQRADELGVQIQVSITHLEAVAMAVAIGVGGGV